MRAIVFSYSENDSVTTYCIAYLGGQKELNLEAWRRY